MQGLTSQWSRGELPDAIQKIRQFVGKTDHPLYFAVADIHACHQALETTLQLLSPLSPPSIFLGDYLDRGDSTFLTLELLIEAKTKRPEWIFLLGNHEALFLNPLKQVTSFPNPAEEEYRLRGGTPSAHLTFLKTLDVYFETQKFIFVHGGVARDCDKPIAEHPIEELIWCYDVHPDWTGKRLVRGHKIVTDPIDATNHISLDTGCYKKTALTTGILDDSTGELIGWLQVSYSGDLITFWRGGSVQS